MYAKVPTLAHLVPYCVGIEFADHTGVNFHFKDTIERDQFYTCIKILRMSVDIRRSRLILSLWCARNQLH